MFGKTMRELYDYCCLHYSNRPAIRFQGQTYTYSDFRDRGMRLANSLRKLGLKKGDRVATMLPNCPEVLFGDLACAQAGFARVPIAAYLQKEDMIYMLRQTEARGFLCHEVFRSQLDAVKNELPDLEHVVCCASEADAVQAGEHHLQALIEAGEKKEIPYAVTEDDLYLLPFTGGTTGQPKGAVHTNRNLVGAVGIELMDLGVEQEEVFLAITPLTHAAMLLVYPIFMKGGCCVPMQGFDPLKFLKTVEAEKVTSTYLVATMIYVLLDHPELAKHDTSSLRNVFYGAMPIASERLKQAIRHFGQVFVQTYGQTESPLLVAVLSKAEHVIEGDPKEVARLASAGRPCVGVKVRIVDLEGNDVPAGEKGEILVWSPTNMLEYLKRPDLTAETLTPDGWVHSGDIARHDEQGYLYIEDRKKDMIISGGFNIFPKEIEDVLCQHPAVAIASVIGVPDDKWGEAVKAVVVKREGVDVTEEELIRFCKEAKGSVMAPKSVEFVESLPLTPLGKANKKAIREKYWKGRSRQVGG